ncbi:hypothetical protein CCACVL1_11385 [Corchorus capsularis]|uniref:Uncharacterized protein n=1 Tax=Corchorus capsularis TaxID=210143 RepID=A0A1R3ILM6_COCAP|nr:hypothetical protein CCACVL1_11385 [Corchorus capsularis]
MTSQQRRKWEHKARSVVVVIATSIQTNVIGYISTVAAAGSEPLVAERSLEEKRGRSREEEI